MDIRKDRIVKLGSVSKLFIKYVLPEFVSNRLLDSFGEYDFKTQTVLIQKQLTDEDSCKTNLHEILHCCVREAHLNQEGNPLASDTDEERVVAQFETQIYQFFLDNPDEVAYIFYDILKNNPATRKLISTIR